MQGKEINDEPFYYYEVLLAYPLEQTFTYSSKEKLTELTVVEVSLRNKILLGLIISTREKPTYTVREINTAINWQMTQARWGFLTKMARYNMLTRGAVLKMMLPVKSDFSPLTNFTPVKMHATFSLTAEQQQAADRICNSASFQAIALKGVTGSGKTETYLHAVLETIARGGQVLILLPEIFLTTQLIERFSERLGSRPIEWHSNLTPKQRRMNFAAIVAGQAPLVVAARSGLFLPFKNLQLIIIDEEHDTSYKQEEGGCYHARDMAVWLAQILNITIVLASATLSLETIFNIKQGRYHMVTLPQRFSKVAMPNIALVDNSKLERVMLSPLLQQHIKTTISANKQVLLYLNRRGYAPISMCKSCLAKVSCKNCNAYLVYHKSRNLLRCHHCGYQHTPTAKCYACGQDTEFINYGPGVEKLAEELGYLNPDWRILILSSDTMANKNKMLEQLEKINNQEVDIIIGTQIVGKGLHFASLHLVGIIDADAATIGGDIRALERTYQALQQVAGRAGREQEQGQVIMQTRFPESAVMQNLQNYQEEAFLEQELLCRKHAHMPPYTRLVSILCSSHKELNVLAMIKNLQKSAPQGIEGINILGPSPAPIFYLHRQYRYRYIIVAERHLNVQALIKQWLSNVPEMKNVKIKVDIDPYSFV